MFGSYQDLFPNGQPESPFTDPFNPVNMNPGQWGVNPYYLTPAYTAPFRPQQAFSPFTSASLQGAYTSLPSAANYGFNPFSTLPPQLQGNSVQAQNAGIYSSIGGRPFDSAMRFMQHGVVPFAAQYYLGNMGWKMGRGLARSTAQDFMEGLLGRELGEGALASAGLGLAGTAGGLIGSIALPAAAFEGFNQLARHYVRQVQSRQTFLSDFGGMNLGPGGGNVLTGMGLSRVEAANLAQNLDYQGSKSFIYNGGDIENIADMAAKTGLLDNTRREDLSKKIGQISATTAALVRLWELPSIRDGVEALAKLQTMGGLNLDQALQTASSIQKYASIAGTTSQHLMNTVGSQSMYMFSAAGLTPGAGLTVAASTYANMQTAFRQGLISRNELMRVGGIEGATQSYVQGEIQAAQSPLLQMAGYDLLKGRKLGRNITDITSAYGRSAVRDPYGTIGGQLLEGPGIAQEMVKNGSMGMILGQMASLAPGVMDSKGKITAAQAAGLLSSMGFDRSAIVAYLTQYQANNTEAGLRTTLQGLKGNLVNQKLNFQRQIHQDYGVFNSPVYGAMSLWNSVSAGASELFGLPSEGGAHLGDSVEKWFTSARMGASGPIHWTDEGSQALPRWKWTSASMRPTSPDYEGRGTILGDMNRARDRINAAAKGGQQWAKDLIQEIKSSKPDPAKIARMLSANQSRLGISSDNLAKISRAMAEGVTSPKPTADTDQVNRDKLMGRFTEAHVGSTPYVLRSLERRFGINDPTDTLHPPSQLEGAKDILTDTLTWQLEKDPSVLDKDGNLSFNPKDPLVQAYAKANKVDLSTPEGIAKLNKIFSKSMGRIVREGTEGYTSLIGKALKDQVASGRKVTDVYSPENVLKTYQKLDLSTAQDTGSTSMNIDTSTAQGRQMVARQEEIIRNGQKQVNEYNQKLQALRSNAQSGLIDMRSFQELKLSMQHSADNKVFSAAVKLFSDTVQKQLSKSERKTFDTDAAALQAAQVGANYINNQ